MDIFTKEANEIIEKCFSYEDYVISSSVLNFKSTLDSLKSSQEAFYEAAKDYFAFEFENPSFYNTMKNYLKIRMQDDKIDEYQKVGKFIYNLIEKYTIYYKLKENI